MEKLEFLLSEFFFSIALGLVGLLFALSGDIFSTTDVFLGIIAGSLIDMNIRSFYKSKSVKISGYLEHKPNFLSNESNEEDK